MILTRDALAAALAIEDKYDRQHAQRSQQQQTLVDAARERLAQLPELVDDPECVDCDHLPRKVYPAELVERIAEAIAKAYFEKADSHHTALTVLDVLNSEIRVVVAS